MARILVVLFFCSVISCTEKPINKFSDDVVIRIADFQDHRYSDSLYQFFEHENPLYRKDAVLAFASIQDTLAIERLSTVLERDSDAGVKSAAAFALGQTGTVKAFNALLGALITEKDKTVLREIIEACGKTSSSENTSQIVVNDTSSNEAVAWSYFRLGLRGIADSTTVLKAIPLLEDEKNLDARMGAAYFFGRGPRDISAAEASLKKAALEDASPYTRMTATSALRKINTPSSLETIKKTLAQDKDYRVRSNAARSLQTFPIKDTKQNLFDALKDSNQHVGVAASEVIIGSAR